MNTIDTSTKDISHDHWKTAILFNIPRSSKKHWSMKRIDRCQLTSSMTREWHHDYKFPWSKAIRDTLEEGHVVIIDHI